MELLALVAFTGLELWALASLGVTVGSLLGLVFVLERHVFGRSDADPVGLAELERDEDVDGDAWR